MSEEKQPVRSEPRYTKRDAEQAIHKQGEQLGNFLPEDAPSYEDILQCMRCGFCLPHCPTFAITNRERSSPRGRAQLAKAVAQGELELSEAVCYEGFFCLDCRACTTVCPAGVKVGPIMEHVRAQSRNEAHPLPPGWRQFREFLLEYMLPNHDRLEDTMLAARLYQRLGVQWMVRNSHLLELTPGTLGETAEKMDGMLPKLEPPLRNRVPELVKARGEKRGTVAYFVGCIMNLMYPEVSRATINTLAHQGFDVVIPKSAKCCGAPHLTEGDRETARQLGEHNVETFLRWDLDAIVTDCAGCGAALKEYEELLEGRMDGRYLHEFRSRIQDVSEFLVGAGMRTEDLKPVEMTITYHDPCHLAHAQGIAKEPRQLIEAIPGLKLVEMFESNWCCGSGANWGLLHPEESEQVLDRKMANVVKTEADAVVTLNPGCHMQLAWGVKRSGLEQEAYHLMELVGRSLPEEAVPPAS